jgi:oligopeptide/dipeptide ABC transporter ATP-binding protein
MANLLEVKNLVTRFHTSEGTVHAVNGVSYTLNKGESLGIVGESGSGKSVSVLSIMGLIPNPPGKVEGGEVHFEGQNLLALSSSKIREIRGRDIAMVFQDPMTSLNPVLTIRRQLTEGLERHLDMTGAAADKRAAELLELVGIPNAADRLSDYPHQFSGGQRQRIGIAMALSCNPSLLIADEPTTALDVTVQAQILDLLGEQQRERHMAVILVSHDLGVVAGRTHDIAVMYAGQIVEQAPTRTLFAEVRMPYTEALLRSVPRLENPSHTRLAVIGGRPPDLIDPPAGCRFAARCPYVQDRCREEQPPLVEGDTPGHLFRCWYPVGTDAGREALERNLAAQLPQAEAAVTGELAVEAS